MICNVTVMLKCVVAFPLIGEDYGARCHVVLYQPEEGMMVAFFFWTLRQEALPSSPAVTTRDPLAHNSASTVVLSFPKFRLINLHDVARSSDFPPTPRSSTMLCRTDL